jgi:hypothetical protein
MKEENCNCFGSEAFVELENRAAEYGSAAAIRVSVNAGFEKPAMPMPVFRFETLLKNDRADFDR